MEFIDGMYKLWISWVALGISMLTKVLNNYYDWFDPTSDIVVFAVGLISGIFTIRWLYVKTKNIKEQGELDKKNTELEISLHELEIEKLKSQKK